MSPDLKSQEPPQTSPMEDRRVTPRPAHATPLPSHGRVVPATATIQLPLTEQAGSGRSKRRLAQIALAVLAGLFVGGAMLLAEPFQHHCGATFQIANASDLAQFGKYRKELMGFVWGDDQKTPQQQGGSKWQVGVPTAGVLRIAMETSDADLGAQQAEAMARGFLTHLQALNESEWSIPTESESFLQSYTEVLTKRLDDAQKQLDTAMVNLPKADPRPDKGNLMDRWHSVRGDFDTARTQLRQAGDEFKRLTQQGELTHAAVSAEERQAALMADADLQQDIKELGATLTELKLHMLNVWQKSSASLEQLGAAAATGLTHVSDLDAETTPSSMREAYAAIASEMAAYRDAAAAFAKGWNAEFSELQHAELNTQEATLLDAYQRAKTMLNEFLFHAGNRLSAVRESVNQLSRDPADDAKHHLRQSDAARASAELQTAHHRFEFAAGAIDTPNNFRLDSALRIARGLRRRVADRIRAINEGLQKLAIARATDERNRTMSALDDILRKSREASDATTEELIALQDGLQTASASSEQFVAAVANAELANNRLQLTRTDLNQAENQLRELAEKRATAQRGAELKIVSAGVLQKNVNLHDRLRVAGVGASVTCLAVLLGQIVFARFLWPAR